jgi:trehalose 6-phosphate phosphatase
MTENQVPNFSDRWAVFLDVDGTLLHFAEHLEAVQFAPDLIQTLVALQQRVPLALISGRSLDSLDKLFGTLRLAAAGQHGAERRDGNGVVHRRNRLAGLSMLKESLQTLADGQRGTLIEDKGNTLAFHYRGAPELQARIKTLITDAMQNDGNYHLLCGNMVYEVREQGIDKGTTIQTFMREAPYLGRVPVFLGDDTTDEDGFVQVNALGGHSIKVGAGVTAARWRLHSVDAVLQWLQDYVAWFAEPHGDRGDRQ